MASPADSDLQLDEEHRLALAAQAGDRSAFAALAGTYYDRLHRWLYQLTRDLIELRNAIQTALLVVHAASLNPRSKGCHYVVEES